MTVSGFQWRDRLWAAGIHLGISATIAALSALLVFALWYPYPYREVSGGRELFFLVVSVDVLLGPLITFSVFNRRKPMTELRRDLAIVGVLQLAALGYGLWTVFLARPVHLVFEIDRFRVVHAVEVDPELLPKAPPALRAEPLLGPTLLSVRDFKDSKERLDATMAALGGAQLGSRPDFWQPYELAKDQVVKAAHPLTHLYKRFPDKKADIDAALAGLNRKPEDLIYLPLVARKFFWTVLIDPSNAQIVGYLPLDPY